MTIETAIDRRALVLGGLLIAGGGAAVARQPRATAARIDKGHLERFIPKRIGAWSYQPAADMVLPPADELSDKLYSGLVTRRYDAPGHAPVMLLVAYSNVQDGMLQLHRPEVCYPASGYRLSETREVDISNGIGGTIAANAFSADGVSRIEQVLYWTRIGQSFPTRWIKQRAAVVSANLAGYIPDGVLVRLSRLAPEMGDTLPDLSAFAAALVAAAGPEGRRILTGA